MKKSTQLLAGKWISVLVAISSFWRDKKCALDSMNKDCGVSP